MRDIRCHAFGEQFVTYAWQMARHGANYASPCRLDRLHATKIPMTWQAILRGVAGRKFVPLWGLLEVLAGKLATVVKHGRLYVLAVVTMRSWVWIPLGSQVHSVTKKSTSCWLASLKLRWYYGALEWQVNHLSAELGTQVYSAWAIPLWVG